MSALLLRRAQDRGAVHSGWLDSRHSFSFGHYYDPAWMGFGALRVINEDRVQAGQGFRPHGHANMEILSFVLSGHLVHEDTLGNRVDLQAGDVQWMSAGEGIEHSEFNGSASEDVHFLQVWIQPDRVNAVPAHQKATVTPPAPGAWSLIAAPGVEGALPIRQDARVLQGTATAEAPLQYPLERPRKLWMQVVEGEVTVDGEVLHAGDGAGLAREAGTLTVTSSGRGSLLLFDLPE